MNFIFFFQYTFVKLLNYIYYKSLFVQNNFFKLIVHMCDKVDCTKRLGLQFDWSLYRNAVSFIKKNSKNARNVALTT